MSSHLISKLRTREVQEKLVFLLLLIALIVAIIPLLMIAHYNSMSADDYSFGALPQSVFDSTHSVLAVLASQITESARSWHTWQGTYFSEWLMSSLLGLFGKNHYYLGAYISLGGMVIAEIVSFHLILKKLYDCPFYQNAILIFSILIIQILFMPAPNEGFYWFCGAIVYTFIYDLCILCFGLTILLWDQKISKRRVCLIEVAIVLLLIAIGGSNYITGILMLVILFLQIAMAFIFKHRHRILFSINGVLYLVAFLLNIVAPGNQKRQATSGITTGAIKSIVLALVEAAKCITQWTILPFIIVGLLLVPLIWRMVSKKNYRYSLPLLVTIISYGVFASLFVPNIYALGGIGGGRNLNMYKTFYFIWLYSNEFYWLGWLSNQVQIQKRKVSSTSVLLPIFLLGVICFAFSCTLWGGRTITTYNAIYSLKTGEARQFQEENDTRLAIYNDETIKEVYLPPYTVYPYLLYFTDLQLEAEHWINKAVARAFHKDVVQLIESP